MKWSAPEERFLYMEAEYMEVEMKWDPAWKKFDRESKDKWLPYFAVLPRRCGYRMGMAGEKEREYCSMTFWWERGYRHKSRYYEDWKYLCRECAVARALVPTHAA